MFTACNDTIANCEECNREKSNIICTRCGEEYYTYEGSDCTGKQEFWGRSTLYSHTNHGISLVLYFESS